MSNRHLDELTSLVLWGTPADDGVVGRSAHPERKNLRDVINAIGFALPSTTPADAGRLRHRLGYLALLAGDVRNKAIEAFTMTRDHAVETGDRQLEALAECGLSAAYDFLGERHNSLEHALAARRLAEDLGDSRVLAVALNAEAQFYKENGENPRAFEMFKRIEAIGRELNDQQLIMGAHIGMGRTTPMEQAAVGIRHYEQAIDIARAEGDDAALALCLNNLSDWKIYTGHYEEALELREESLRLSQRLGLRPDIGRALIGQAKVHTIMGNLDDARALLDRGFPVVVSTGDLEGDLHSQLNLAYLYVQGGDVPRAVDLYRQVLEKSLAAPDHACAVFAQRALELLGEGRMPKPGILPDQPVPVNEEQLAEVSGGHSYTYPTGDRAFFGN
jgi:tetratricopeptide (TPR) repeat protein